MELFPSQPDLSLQIGLPASATPHDHHHGAAALSARFLAAAAAVGGVSGGNGVPGGNPAAAMAPSLQLPMPMPLPLPVQLPMPMPMPPNAAAGTGGGLYYHPDAAAAAGMLRPIRGVPLYQHPHTHAVPPTFPPHAAGAGPCFCEPCHVAAGAWRRAGCGVGARVAGLGFPPAKRAARAPRMRWTSTLHARFVHAVELLGGHESTYMPLFRFRNPGPSSPHAHASALALPVSLATFLCVVFLFLHGFFFLMRSSMSMNL
jgi:hypothetical protein